MTPATQCPKCGGTGDIDCGVGGRTCELCRGSGEWELLRDLLKTFGKEPSEQHAAIIFEMMRCGLFADWDAYCECREEAVR